MNQRNQLIQSILHIATKPQLYLGTTPQTIRIDIHLYDRVALWHECLVWKIGSQQHQHLCLMHTIIAGRHAQ